MKLDRAIATPWAKTLPAPGDLTVFAPIQVLPDTRRRVPFTVELKNTPFKQQEQAPLFHLRSAAAPGWDLADARGNGQYLAEQAAHRYGQEVVQVMLGRSSTARTCRASRRPLKMTSWRCPSTKTSSPT